MTYSRDMNINDIFDSRHRINDIYDTVYLIITTGQSNGVGQESLSTSGIPVAPSAYGNKKIEWLNDTVDGSFTLLPLQQFVRSINHNIINNVSPSFTQAEWLSKAVKNRYGIDPPEIWVLNASHNGASLAQIKKTTTPYTRLVNAITYARAQAAALGKNLVVPYVGFIHGESDAVSRTATYVADVNQYYTDLKADIKAITKQENDPWIVVSQIGWSFRDASNIPHEYDTIEMAIKQNALTSNNGRVIMAGPTYMFNINPVEAGDNKDNAHFDGAGSERLGEYLSKGFFNGFKGAPVECRASGFVLVSNIITFNVSVPVAPLVLDAAENAACQNNMYGFQFTDGAGTTITAVELVGANQIKITLSATPTGTKTLYYCNAMEYTVSSTRYIRQHGAVHDSDSTASTKAYSLKNYLLAFKTIL